MKVVTSFQMNEIDEITSREYGIPSIILMENAGIRCTEVIRELFPQLRKQTVSILAGTGNNGGDGFVVARQLFNEGISVKVFLIGREENLSELCSINLKIAQAIGIPVEKIASSKSLMKEKIEIINSDLIVDSIFGTGLRREVTGFIREAIELLNSSGKPIISIDVPSGLNVDTGEILGTCVHATCTITFGLPKIGLLVPPGLERRGELRIVNIGFPKRLLIDEKIKVNLLTKEDISSLLPTRPIDAHKGTCGRVVVVAGSIGMSGAAALVCEGALHSGAGLVLLCIPRSLNSIMEVKLTEALTHPLPETNQLTLSLEAFEPIKELLSRSQVVVLGPGMGLHDETARLVRKLTTDSPIPIVIDADALTMISAEPSILKKAKAEIVITPHPGEAARLLKKTPKEIQSNRIGSSQKLATEYGVVCVLKGAATIVADQQANTFINPTGNPGMASGGTGDVLAGMIGGLIAQGLRVVDAAKVGVYLHGLAGDLVKKEKGEMSLVAKDLLSKLPEAILSLS